ncbi:GGDEF domain-containing protein [Streptomyces antimycoticus]
MLDALLPAAAIPAAGWAAHAVLLHRRLTAVRHDPLSGLLTRDGWSRRARRIIRRPNAAVILLDLDGFKQINDRYGHAAGDAVIAATGERLAAWCGRTGIAGRLGGDEFVIAVAADSPLEDTLTELRTALAQPVEHDGKLLRPGASLGVARVADLAEPTLSKALGAADRAMYRDKGRGRRGRRRPVLAPIAGAIRRTMAPLAGTFGKAA